MCLPRSVMAALRVLGGERCCADHQRLLRGTERQSIFNVKISADRSEATFEKKSFKPRLSQSFQNQLALFFRPENLGKIVGFEKWIA